MSEILATLIALAATTAAVFAWASARLCTRLHERLDAAAAQLAAADERGALLIKQVSLLYRRQRSRDRAARRKLENA